MEMDKPSGREEGLNWVLKDKQEIIWDLGKKAGERMSQAERTLHVKTQKQVHAEVQSSWRSSGIRLMIHPTLAMPLRLKTFSRAPLCIG